MGWQQQFGRNLHYRRQNSGMSLRSLGEAIGVSGETIRQYERGRIPDADKLAKLSVVLNTSEFVLDDFKISIVQRERTQQAETEQLSLDFTAEYTSSRAKIQIRPGSVYITFSGVRVTKAS